MPIIQHQEQRKPIGHSTKPVQSVIESRDCSILDEYLSTITSHRNKGLIETVLSKQIRVNGIFYTRSDFAVKHYKDYRVDMENKRLYKDESVFLKFGSREAITITLVNFILWLQLNK